MIFGASWLMGLSEGLVSHQPRDFPPLPDCELTFPLSTLGGEGLRVAFGQLRVREGVCEKG